MSKSGGVFQIDDVTRTMSKGGGCAPGVPPIQVQTPPTWLAGYGPGSSPGAGEIPGRSPRVQPTRSHCVYAVRHMKDPLANYRKE